MDTHCLNSTSITSLGWVRRNFEKWEALVLLFRDHTRMTFALRGEGVVQKQARVVIGCVRVTVTRARGSKIL